MAAVSLPQVSVSRGISQIKNLGSLAQTEKFLEETLQIDHTSLTKQVEVIKNTYVSSSRDVLGKHVLTSIEKGDLIYIFALLKLNLLPLEGEYSIGHALVKAVDSGRENVVKLLLPYCEKLPLKGEYSIGHSFFKAASWGRENVVKLLLTYCKKLEGQYSIGDALVIAASWGQENVVKLLLPYCKKLEGTYSIGNALITAAIWDKEKVVKLLLLYCEKLPLKGKYGVGDALVKAAKSGQEKVVKLLLPCCKKLEGAHSIGVALIAAIDSNREKVFKFFLNSPYLGFSLEGEYGLISIVKKSKSQEIKNILLIYLYSNRQWQRIAILTAFLRANRQSYFKFSGFSLVGEIMKLLPDTGANRNKKRKNDTI